MQSTTQQKANYKLVIESCERMLSSTHDGRAVVLLCLLRYSVGFIEMRKYKLPWGQIITHSHIHTNIGVLVYVCVCVRAMYSTQCEREKSEQKKKLCCIEGVLLLFHHIPSSSIVLFSFLSFFLRYKNEF